MRFPLRARIAAWFVTLLALILTGLGAFLIVQLRTDLVGAIDKALPPAAAQIRHDVSVDGAREFPDSARTVLKGERPAAQLLTPTGAIVTSFGDVIARAPMSSRADIAAAWRGHQPVHGRTLGPGHDDFRVTSVGVVVRDGRRYVIVAALSSESVDRSVGRLVRLLVLGGSISLLLSALAGWWLARRALRPVERITRTAESIGVDRLADRVPPGPNHDEVGHLARTMNTMLDRIQQGVLEQRRLVADTSHELRAPLAVMRSELDVSLRGDGLPPAAREVLLSAREEVDGLSRTVDGLLILAAADDAPAAAPTRTVDLAGVARTAASDGTPITDVFTVTHQTKTIKGVRATVINDRVLTRGRVTERTNDWYAQDKAGNVWYLGEKTATYKADGTVESREGSWQAGVNGAIAGIFMPAHPKVGQFGEQEYYAGHAQDTFKILRFNVHAHTRAVVSSHAMLVQETTPLEPGVVDHKLYVRGIGTVREANAKGGNETLQLVSVHRP